MRIPTEIIFACDIDKYCKETYFANHSIKEDKWIEDIHNIDGKKFKGNTHENTNRLKQTIIAINGDRDKSKINDFIDEMQTTDTLALRTEARRVSPNIDLGLQYECEACGYEGEVQLPLDLGFFGLRQTITFISTQKYLI